ncbi:MAG: hypothetical protein JO274_07170 [Gammaproteobacteria bacterium]|nr:hypothetical protein [Gammaproteobacteria bacterium]
MKRPAGLYAVLALTAAGIVAAQTTSPPTPPSDRSTYPSSTSPSTSSSSSGSYNSSTSTTTSKSHDQQMKDCMAQEHANNPNMSKSDMKKACKSQMQSSGSNPHQ